MKAESGNETTCHSASLQGTDVVPNLLRETKIYSVISLYFLFQLLINRVINQLTVNLRNTSMDEANHSRAAKPCDAQLMDHVSCLDLLTSPECCAQTPKDESNSAMLSNTNKNLNG